MITITGKTILYKKILSDRYVMAKQFAKPIMPLMSQCKLPSVNGSLEVHAVYILFSFCFPDSYYAAVFKHDVIFGVSGYNY